MAHYALINNENIVVNVIVGIDEDISQTDLDGTIVGGSSEAWETFYSSLPWFAGLYCKRTSYNTYGGINSREGGEAFRKNYAGIGYHYDGVGFYAPQPFPSWIKDEETYLWNAPVPMPTEGFWLWDEESLSWLEQS